MIILINLVGENNSIIKGVGILNYFTAGKKPGYRRRECEILTSISFITINGFITVVGTGLLVGLAS